MGHDHRGSVNGESLMQPTGPAYIFGYQLRIEKYDTWYVVHLYSTNASLSQKGITGKAMQPAALELVQKCKPALTVSNRPRSIYIILQTRSNMYMNQMIEYAHRTFSYYILNIYMDKSQSSSARLKHVWSPPHWPPPKSLEQHTASRLRFHNDLVTFAIFCEIL